MKRYEMRCFAKRRNTVDIASEFFTTSLQTTDKNDHSAFLLEALSDPHIFQILLTIRKVYFHGSVDRDVIKRMSLDLSRLIQPFFF